MCRCRLHHRILNHGFSLIELIIVIAIIGIVVSISALNFNQWMVNNRVQAQVKRMVSDISELRIRAMTQKQRQSFTLNPSSYVFKYYSSNDEPKCSAGGSQGGKDFPGSTTNVTYKLMRGAGNYYAGSCSNIGGDTFEIDQRGLLVGSDATVFIDYPGSSAGLDCLTIHSIRVNAGKTNGANCENK